MNKKTNEMATHLNLMGVDKRTGCVILSILDGDGWADEATHLDELQDKVYRFLDSIEEGELAAIYPDAPAKGTRIQIHFAGRIPQSAEKLLGNLAREAAESEVELCWDVIG